MAQVFNKIKVINSTDSNSNPIDGSITTEGGIYCSKSIIANGITSSNDINIGSNRVYLGQLKSYNNSSIITDPLNTTSITTSLIKTVSNDLKINDDNNNNIIQIKNDGVIFSQNITAPNISNLSNSVDTSTLNTSTIKFKDNTGLDIKNDLDSKVIEIDTEQLKINKPTVIANTFDNSGYSVTCGNVYPSNIYCSNGNLEIKSASVFGDINSNGNISCVSVSAPTLNTNTISSTNASFSFDKPLSITQNLTNNTSIRNVTGKSSTYGCDFGYNYVTTANYSNAYFGVRENSTSVSCGLYMNSNVATLSNTNNSPILALVGGSYPRLRLQNAIANPTTFEWTINAGGLCYLYEATAGNGGFAISIAPTSKNVSIGDNAPDANNKLKVVGKTLMQGDLTIQNTSTASSTVGSFLSPSIAHSYTANTLIGKSSTYAGDLSYNYNTNANTSSFSVGVRENATTMANSMALSGTNTTFTYNPTIASGGNANTRFLTPNMATGSYSWFRYGKNESFGNGFQMIYNHVEDAVATSLNNYLSIGMVASPRTVDIYSDKFVCLKNATFLGNLSATSGSINFGSQSQTCGALSCGSIVSSGSISCSNSTISNGLTCKSINSGTYPNLTFSNSINLGPNDILANNLTLTGDINASNSSLSNINTLSTYNSAITNATISNLTVNNIASLPAMNSVTATTGNFPTLNSTDSTITNATIGSLTVTGSVSLPSSISSSSGVFPSLTATTATITSATMGTLTASGIVTANGGIISNNGPIYANGGIVSKEIDATGNITATGSVNSAGVNTSVLNTRYINSGTYSNVSFLNGLDLMSNNISNGGNATFSNLTSLSSNVMNRSGLTLQLGSTNPNLFGNIYSDTLIFSDIATTNEIARFSTSSCNFSKPLTCGSITSTTVNTNTIKSGDDSKGVDIQSMTGTSILNIKSNAITSSQPIITTKLGIGSNADNAVFSVEGKDSTNQLTNSGSQSVKMGIDTSNATYIQLNGGLNLNKTCYLDFARTNGVDYDTRFMQSSAGFSILSSTAFTISPNTTISGTLTCDGLVTTNNGKLQASYQNINVNDLTTLPLTYLLPFFSVSLGHFSTTDPRTDTNRGIKNLTGSTRVWQVSYNLEFAVRNPSIYAVCYIEKYSDVGQVYSTFGKTSNFLNNPYQLCLSGTSLIRVDNNDYVRLVCYNGSGGTITINNGYLNIVEIG